MTAKIISGTRIAAELYEEIAHRKERLVASGGPIPGLATILVGDDPASRMYVGMKNKAAARVGIASRQVTLPADVSQDRLLGMVAGLNADPAVHGILVQLPLPETIKEAAVIETVSPTKDVDGFHPINVGRLATGSGSFFAPCTPAGVVEMLRRSGSDPSGRHAVVVGRSNIVGRPLANLLSRKAPGGDATVTLCHSRTRNLAEHTRRADILVAAIGRAETITGDMVKPGAVVIDVGANRVADTSSAKGYRVCGDVLYEEVSRVAGALTPVPGGVGPMTIAMLLLNTLRAAETTCETGRSG